MKDDLDLGLKLKMIDVLMHKDMNRMLEELDITIVQHHVLVYLEKNENNTATLKEIEKKFHVAQATMAGIVKRLETKDYVHTYYSASDRRVKYVSITEKGKDICQKAFEHVQNTERRIKEPFTQEELDQFVSYLDRLHETLLKM